MAILSRKHGRLIPTHAGKTVLICFHRLRASAHPHSRGENEAGDEKGSTFDGSSPLTRGKLGPNDIGLDEERLIPTHAGKTRRIESRECRPAAHPHSRGENTTSG